MLALAIKHQFEAIGRTCAARLGIPIRGTLGIVLVAKMRVIIQQAQPVIEDMMKTGLYLSKKVLDKALERVGE